MPLVSTDRDWAIQVPQLSSPRGVALLVAEQALAIMSGQGPQCVGPRAMLCRAKGHSVSGQGPQCRAKGHLSGQGPPCVSALVLALRAGITSHVYLMHCTGVGLKATPWATLCVGPGATVCRAKGHNVTGCSGPGLGYTGSLKSSGLLCCSRVSLRERLSGDFDTRLPQGVSTGCSGPGLGFTGSLKSSGLQSFGGVGPLYRGFGQPLRPARPNRPSLGRPVGRVWGSPGWLRARR